MYTILIVLTIVVSILMCLIVLIQESKGGGLASSFSSSNQIMGVRKTTDVVEKATWALAVVLVVLSVLTTFFIPKATGSESVIMNQAVEQSAVNANNVQGFGASQQPAQAETPAAASETPAAATEAPATTPAE